VQLHVAGLNRSPALGAGLTGSLYSVEHAWINRGGFPDSFVLRASPSIEAISDHRAEQIGRAGQDRGRDGQALIALDVDVPAPNQPGEDDVPHDDFEHGPGVAALPSPTVIESPSGMMLPRFVWARTEVTTMLENITAEAVNFRAWAARRAARWLLIFPETR
jgi:hypothetical protein